MNVPPFLKAAQNGLYIFIKLQPRASKNEIGGAMGNELKVSVTAPPVDSAANQALIDFLADELDCSRSAVQIVKGQTSRHKTIFVSGKTVEEIAGLLNR